MASNIRLAFKATIAMFVFTSVMNITLLLRIMFQEKAKEISERYIVIREKLEIDHPHRLLDLHNFKYVIPQPRCTVKSSTGEHVTPAFVVIIHSAPYKSEDRQILRDSWLRSDPRILSFFILGLSNSTSMQDKIYKENEEYNDIIQGNFVDSYRNMTYKHTLVLKWFDTHCTDVKYLVKMDDDFFMNVPAVFDFLERNKNENHMLMGYSIPPTQVKRRGSCKWFVTREEWADERYPEYIDGPSVFYSKEFVRQAYQKTLTTRWFWIDDLFISGILPMELLVRITPINHLILSKYQHNRCVRNSSALLPESDLLFWPLTLPNDTKLGFERKGGCRWNITTL